MTYDPRTYEQGCRCEGCRALDDDLRELRSMTLVPLGLTLLAALVKLWEVFP